MAAAEVRPAVRAERGDGRHRLRPARPRLTSSRREAASAPCSTPGASRAPGRSRARRGGRAHGGRSPQPGVRRAARRELSRRGRRRRSHSIRRRPAACSSRCPASAPRSSRRRWRGRICRGADRPGRGRAPESFSASGRRRRACPLGLGARPTSASRRRRRFALFLVITSGAFVRLTGSGLGCENWPRCGDKPYPGAGLPRLRRVREPDGRARRHRPHARHRARIAPDRGAVGMGTLGGARARSSSPSRRSRWAGSRSRSTCTRSRS